MAVNPAESGLLVDAHPHLGTLLHDAGLTRGDDEDKLLRYAALVNDPQSPMVRAYPDPKERKVQAAAITGYKAPNHVGNPKAYEAHMKAIVLFMQRVVKSLEWRYIMARYHLYNECEECIYDFIKKGDDVKDTDVIAAYQKKALVSKEMNGIMEEMPALLIRFYGDDKQLQEAAVKIRTAETMADKKK